MKKTTMIYVKVHLEMDDPKKLNEFINELSYDITSNTKGVTVEGTEIHDYDL